MDTVTVKNGRGEFTVDSIDASFEGRQAHPRDYNYAITLGVGPCNAWMSADEAIALADALVRYAHHFIAHATEMKLEHAA